MGRAGEWERLPVLHLLVALPEGEARPGWRKDCTFTRWTLLTWPGKQQRSEGVPWGGQSETESP